MKNDKLIFCLFGLFMFFVCVLNFLFSLDDDGILVIKMVLYVKCMDEIEINLIWIMGSKLLLED